MERNKVLEAAVIFFLTGLCFFWGLRAKVFDVNPGWDMSSYIHMAESARGFMEVPGHHGQRVLGSWTAGLLHHITGFPLRSTFRFLAILAFALLPILVFRVLRPLGVGLWETAVITFLILAADWPIRYSLGNIYQLTDAWTYPWALILILTSRNKSVLIFFVACLAAVLTRQNLLILAVGLYVERYMRTKRWIEIIPLSLIFVLFAIVSKAAGSLIPGRSADSAGGFYMIYHHTFRYFNGDQGAVFHNLWNAIKMVPAWAPLLPLAVGCFLPVVWKSAIRHPSITLFALVTFVQPMIAFDMTGPDNARRLMMQGGFVFMLAGGWGITSFLKESSRWLRYAFLVIPFFLVALYVVSKPLALSDESRLFVGIYLAGLMVASLFLKVRSSVIKA